MKLPPEAELPNQPFKVPEFFIINFMLPITEPSIGSFFDKEPPNGPTGCFHFIFRLSEWARKNQESKAVDLLRRFVEESNDAMRERLKIIVQVKNPEELNLGTLEH